MSDGYNTTITLDCGDTFRLNLTDPDDWKVGHWHSCSSHSEVLEYDQTNGDPIHARDRKITAVTPDRPRSENLPPGTRVSYGEGGDVVTLTHRKRPEEYTGLTVPYHPGWWIDGARTRGLADFVLDDPDSGWVILPAPDTPPPTATPPEVEHRPSMFTATQGEHAGRHYCMACTVSVDDQTIYVDWPCPTSLVIDRLTTEAHQLRLLLQRIRAGWLPHRLGDDGSWWWGRPSAEDGYRLWSTGLVPTMSVAEPMTEEELAAWTASLHPHAPELEAIPSPGPLRPTMDLSGPEWAG